MKPTQEQILSALNKLVRENKTELKAEKIELGLTDDAKAVVKEGKAIQKKMASEYKVWPKIEGEYGKVFGKILDFLDNTKGLTTKAEAIQKQANSIFDKIEKQAKELGVNVTDIPVAKQLDEIAVDLTDNITDIENARRQAKDV
tara:strand:+ start:353 stop:784 length:432 start_codon:yes stop_codon:yes gene_type:complete